MTGGRELISLPAKECVNIDFAVIFFGQRRRNNGVENGLEGTKFCRGDFSCSPEILRCDLYRIVALCVLPICLWKSSTFMTVIKKFQINKHCWVVLSSWKIFHYLNFQICLFTLYHLTKLLPHVEIYISQIFKCNYLPNGNCNILRAQPTFSKI